MDWYTSGRINPAAIVTNVPLPFADADDVQAWMATPPEAPGAIPQAIMILGRVFDYDAADTTSAHDGIWTAVSSDGRRYKASDLPQLTSAESNTVTAPPAIITSLYGKAWIVPAAATGAWAGHSGDVAVATGRGWLFIPPRAGMQLLVKSQSAFYHYSATLAWTKGLGVPSTGTVDADSLYWPFGLIAESRTLNDPPTGSTRYAYVVGSSPIGAWAGHAGDIAIGPEGGWTFISPAAGAEVWCRAESRYLRYSSGAWSTDAGTLTGARYVADAAALTLAGNTYVYAFATAPTVSNTAASGLQLTHTARSTGNLIRICGRFSQTSTATGTVALFIDGAATASQWLPIAGASLAGVCDFEFIVLVGDTSPHTYAVRFGASITTPAHRHMTIEEMSVLT